MLGEAGGKQSWNDRDRNRKRDRGGGDGDETEAEKEGRDVTGDLKKVLETA